MTDEHDHDPTPTDPQSPETFSGPFDSVADMVRDTCDEEFADEFDAMIAGKEYPSPDPSPDPTPDRPKRPRTPAQLAADYRRTFPRKVNARRLELIDKKFGPPDPDRDSWRFDEHPGWKEECERREHANLTDEERAELAECERVVSEWEMRSPIWAERLESLAEFEEGLKAKIARRSENNSKTAT